MTSGIQLSSGDRLRRWRKSRPFLAGLLTILAGLEIGLVPLYTVRFLLIQGDQGIGSLLVSVTLVGCGILLWREPRRHFLLGAVIFALGFTSYVVTNLGGFVIGMLLALLGASLAVAWQPNIPEHAASQENSE
jgi:hypothetical protein